jgi:hypothetical protein
MNEDIVLKLTGITKDFYQGRSLIEVLKGVNLEVKKRPDGGNSWLFW